MVAEEEHRGKRLSQVAQAAQLEALQVHQLDRLPQINQAHNHSPELDMDSREGKQQSGGTL
jgi:hypothetical protein